MNKEDKQRVIGKVVAINSDRFTIELLSGIDNFNISGFDDIHYFAQLNSYVIIPYQNYYIVAEVSGVREKDLNVPFSNPKEQILNKVKSGKFLEVLPIGTIKSNLYKGNEHDFEFGVSVYPALYTDTLYIKETELDAIFNVKDSSEKICDGWEGEGECPHGDNRRYKTLSIGKSTIFPDYDVKVDIDKFFGSHCAILGNTGSGKSCTISSMLQSIYKLKNYSATGSSFVFFDVNGEYQQAFSEISNRNEDVTVRCLSLDEKNMAQQNELFTLPNWFLNIDEWALLLKATERTQLPILRNALGLAALFTKNVGNEVNKIKDHILAICITQILRDETSSPSKKDRITSILQKFNTPSIHLNQKFQYKNRQGVTSNSSFHSSLQISFGELVGLEPLISYLEQKGNDGIPKFLTQDFQMPIYENETKFDFNYVEDAIDLAILFEEAHGNRQIRDYCSSLVTRIKSIKDRPDYKFLRKVDGDIDEYRRSLLGIKNDNQKLKKDSQIVIIDLSTVEDEIVEVVSCVIARLLYETIKGFQPRNSFPVNLVLEEAHRYIGNNPQREFLKANTIFESIAKEGRKFGMFLIVSSQRPSELSKTVLSQCSNFIVHRIQNPEDLSHIRQITPHISETILKRMPSIPTQHALIFGHSVNLPTTFKVNNADPLPLSDNNKVSENWFRTKNEALAIKTDFKIG